MRSRKRTPNAYDGLHTETTGAPVAASGQNASTVDGLVPGGGQSLPMRAQPLGTPLARSVRKTGQIRSCFPDGVSGSQTSIRVVPKSLSLSAGNAGRKTSV